MRIFVAGATGVVGRRVVPLLVAGGHQVTAVGRDPARLAALERAGAAAVRASLFDPAALRGAVAGHDAVMNLATHIPRSAVRGMLPGGWRENDRVRREGSRNLVDAALAAGVGRYVQESFAPIYEDGGDRWLDERAPVRPVRYNRTVLDAEHAAARVTAAGGAGVVLRFAMFYGADAAHLDDLLAMVRRGVAPLPGRAGAYVSSVSHDDAATAAVAALTLPAGSYNVCDDEPLTRADYAAALAAPFGLAHPREVPRWLVALMGSLGELLSRSVRLSNARLRGHGWAPRWRSVREGFAAVAAERAGLARAEGPPVDDVFEPFLHAVEADRRRVGGADRLGVGGAGDRAAEQVGGRGGGGGGEAADGGGGGDGGHGSPRGG